MTYDVYFRRNSDNTQEAEFGKYVNEQSSHIDTTSVEHRESDSPVIMVVRPHVNLTNTKLMSIFLFPYYLIHFTKLPKYLYLLFSSGFYI
jgi:hypothetical protein